MEYNLEEDDVVLCTVTRIEGTTVFLDIQDNGQGTMIFSEVSPGRIRNIREFVVRNKKVVCKILRIKDSHPELSLRRVTGKEREMVMERFEKEKVLKNMMKPILKDNTDQILIKIKEDYDLSDFLDEARENPELIDNYVPKSESSALQKIFQHSKTSKIKVVKEIITLRSNEPSGLLDIQSVLKNKDAEIRYLGSSKFSIIVKGENYKTVNALIEQIIQKIKTDSKERKVTVLTKEK